MNQEHTPISSFDRNTDLESRIDRIIALHYMHSESIKLYLDVMDELVEEYNQNSDRYNIGRLSNYIKYATVNTRRYTDLQSLRSNNYFNNSEVDYLRSLDEYLTDLRSTFLGFRFTIVDFHHYIQNVIKKHNQESVLDCELMQAEIIQYVNKFKYLAFRTQIIGGNLYVYLHNYRKYCIVLVGNSETFQTVDERWHVTIIVLNRAPLLLSKIKDSYNITFIDYLSDRGHFNRIDVRSPLDWCVIKLRHIIMNVERFESTQAIVTRLSKVVLELKKIDDYSKIYPVGIGDLDINEIKLQKRKLIGIDDDLLECFDHKCNSKRDLCMVIRALGLLCKTIENYFNLDSSISFAISEIKKSNTLYIVSKNLKKDESISFGEENLSAILASNLRCLLHKQENISVNCESMVGNGRSDVRVNIGNKTIGIIESKLIKKGKNVEEETRNALDQLYSRYSENECLENHRDVKLYLVIFSYDKNFKTMAKSIKTAIYSYAKRNDLDYEKIEMSENGMTFIYTESRNHLGLLDKERTIKIMICNMEIDYQSRSKQRTQRKLYTP